jgi:DNA mismatch repair protein MutS
LFAAPPETDTAGPTPLELALTQINPDTLSPREALDALYALQRLQQRSA